MLISQTSIKILFLLIIAICYQITTKNNTSLYLQHVYATDSAPTSTGSEQFPEVEVKLSDLLRKALDERERANNNNTSSRDDSDDSVSGHSTDMYPTSEFDDFDSDDDHQYDNVYSIDNDTGNIDDDNISTDDDVGSIDYDIISTDTDCDNTSSVSAPTPKDKAKNENNEYHHVEVKPFNKLQENAVIDHTSAAQYHNTSSAVIHYTSIPVKVVNNFISRKIANNSNSTHVKHIGASESNNILNQQKYELECKYVYNATTIPQKNALGKASIIGAVMNLKYQFSNKLTAGVFYAPTITTYNMHNQGSNNTIASTTKDRIINHCIGMYTSYAITPATYLSNQVSLGFSIVNNKNSSKKHNYPHYFTVDSFVSYKTNVDTTKTISPFLGVSYYSANPRLHYNIGDINNLSLVMGIKFQYEYKYKDLVFAPGVKFTHTRSIYSNISAKMQNQNIIAQGENLIDLLRDFHIAFNPNSSVNLGLSIRRRALRFGAGYEYSIHHECINSYSHTFFARINITF